MNNLFKLLGIALTIVIIVVTIIIFTVPSVKNSLLGSPEDESSKTEEDISSPPSAPIIKDTYIPNKEVLELAETLKQREVKIKENEERIQRQMALMEKEKQDLVKVRNEIQSLHETIAANITKNVEYYIPLIQEAEKKNLKKMAKMFETLSPENANPIMARMPDQTLVIVLSFMKPRSSAKLLAGYATTNPESARRAAELTEKLRNLVIK